MGKRVKWKVAIISIVSVMILSACGSGGGSGGGGNGDNGDQALLTLLEQLFPFTPNQTFDVNAIEFVLRTIPFNLTVPGSAFRARDRFITGNPQALILRGNGLCRRVDSDFYIFFAPGTFDDNNVLKGVFKNGDLQISMDQLEPQRGDCSQ